MYKDPEIDLFLKTEQLLYFRLTFALAGLGLCLLVGWFARADVDLASVEMVVGGAAVYAFLGLVILAQGKLRGETYLGRFNAALLALDIGVLTALVYVTRGIDSDLYFLYLLPILLSSHTFSRRGIFVTAGAVSVAYVGVLVASNSAFLPYLVDPARQQGLAAAYAQKLWMRILARSTILVSVAFVWGLFCEHMSRVAQQGASRLRDQLTANTRLVAETRAQAAREHLINSISSAVRSTLDLDQILKTTVSQLSSALNATRCAIICPPGSELEAPAVFEATRDEHDHDHKQLSEQLCRFMLERKSRYEQNDEDGAIRKTFVFDEPIREWSFKEVREELTGLEFRSLIVQPIMYGVESMGVLLIGECERRRHWTASELELIKSVAGQVAIAIEHARLVEQLSRKNRDLLQKNLHLDAMLLELRTMQSQLIHQEKMASLGRMVAGIAHELNNPVNFVHGNLPYLREYFQELQRIISALESVPKEYRQPVEELKKELKYDFLVTDLDHIIADLGEGSERIRQIIKNLRSFSRLDEAELKEASIQEGIESSLKILSQYYGRDKIPVDMDLAELPPVLCYPGQLNQVWVNILSNAAQALSDGPDPRVSIKTELDDPWVIVSIADNGPGIKAGDQSKIFEPFFTTKPVGQGTGLGLSICHSIIEKHGGQIWFESSEGKGTTFRIKIPLKAQPAVAAGVANEQEL
jgi:signal transduction histidine kinase